MCGHPTVAVRGSARQIACSLEFVRDTDELSRDGEVVAVEHADSQAHRAGHAYLDVVHAVGDGRRGPCVTRGERPEMDRRGRAAEVLADRDLHREGAVALDFDAVTLDERVRPGRRRGFCTRSRCTGLGGRKGERLVRSLLPSAEHDGIGDRSPLGVDDPPGHRAMGEGVDLAPERLDRVLLGRRRLHGERGGVFDGRGHGHVCARAGLARR